MNETTWAIPPALVPAAQVAPAVDSLGERVADDRPLLVARVALLGDTERFGAEAGDGDCEEGGQDDRVLGLGLDTNPVGPALPRGPKRRRIAQPVPIKQHGARDVADGCVALVHATVEELEALGQLVIDLERGRDTQQDDEAEVDHRVHDPGHGLAHEGLHVEPGAEIAWLCARRSWSWSPGCRARRVPSS